MHSSQKGLASPALLVGYLGFSTYSELPVMNTPNQEKPQLVQLGDRLRDERWRLQLGQPEFAAKAGVSKTSQFYYEKGERSPDADYLQKAHAAGIDTHYVITGERARQPDDEFVVIPLHNVAASAGAGATNGDDEAQVHGLCFRRSWLQKRRLQASHLRVIEVTGDSMLGKLSDGDQVLIDMMQTTPKSGYAYVLRQGDELLVKYAQLLPDGIVRVSSENAQYPPYDIDLNKMADVSIIGRVVASTHEW